MESNQLRTLQEQLNNIIENGNSTGDVFKDCIKHLLSTSAQELPAAEFRDKISSLLIHEIKKQDYDPTPLAHYAKEHHNFIQQFLNQHNIENLIWDLRNGPNALPVKSHTKRNFSGSSLVNWIMSHYNIKDRKEARCICDYLNQEENLFYHPKHLFRDDDTMFFFTQAKRVVIIGGGFAGSHIAKSLDKDGAYNIVLIAPKPFECVPSFPFIIGNADHVQKIRAEHRGFLSRTKIIHQKVTTVTPRQVILEDDSHIKYDTLVVATGSAYRMVFEGNNIFDSTCSDDMIAATEALKDANTACVVGAGSVGIEIASEIAARFPEVKLTIISASKEFLERSVPDAHKYVHQYFSSFPGVNLVMGERLQSFENNVVTTDAGTQVQADVLFPCLGFIPRTDILKQFLAESIDEKGFLNSEETLQIRGFPNIFGAGDIVPFDPEKLGQNAEAHADVVVKNIQLLDKKEKLKTYSPSNRVMLISLGPKRCLMINGNHVLMEGSATRKLKTLVEKKIMFSFH